MSAECHPDCVIGPNADHHGTSEYRCMDSGMRWLPFPGEPYTIATMGDLWVYVFEPFDDFA